MVWWCNCPPWGRTLSVALLWVVASALPPSPPAMSSLTSAALERRGARVLQAVSSSESTPGPSPASRVTTESPTEAQTQAPTALSESLAHLYPECVGFLASISSGWCTKENNNLECGFDGGDCCECTCVDGPEHVCGSHGYICRDPEAKCDLSAGSEMISHAFRHIRSAPLGAISVSCVAAMVLGL